MTPRALVVTSGLDHETTRDIVDLGQAIGVRVDCGGPELTPVADGGVVIGALPSGERRIPEAIGRLAEGPGARIVLLSREPLRRPVTTLAGGAVTVLGLPLDVPRLATLLRGPAGRAPWSPALTRGRVELLEQAWWCASGCGAGAEGAIELHHAHGVLTALVRFERGPELQAVDLATLLDQAATDTRREAQLWEAVGIEAGVVQVSADGDEWLCYWPRHDLPLQLWSSQRLPARWPVSDALRVAQRRMIRIAGYPGDQLVLLVGAPGAAALERARAGMAGPALRDALAEAAGPGAAWMLVELR